MNFNIETYLHSLPEDIETIDIQFRDLTFIPSLERFTKLKKLYCANNRLTSLPPLNESIVTLHCYNNQLTSLPPLNENVKELCCSENKLTSLPPLNEKLEELYCANNQLTSLPYLNEKLKKLYCNSNQLTSLPPLNENLKDLDCNENQLTSLPYLNEKLKKLKCAENQLTSLPPLNEKLEELDCAENQLTSLPYLNEKLKKLYSYGNPQLNEIIIISGMILRLTDEAFTNGTSYLNICKKEIQTINNFRYLYYSLKFKKRFFDFLWLKIREPKIRKRYHPSNVIENLQDTDLDDFLDNWLLK
jgi:Leucine-rich repeat (LRR) protein